MIFSHVLYQLSYPGIAAATVEKDRQTMGALPMPSRGAPVHSVCASSIRFVVLFGPYRSRQGGAGERIAIGEPLDEVVVAAAQRAERRVFRAARLVADRAFSNGGVVHGAIA